MSESCARILEDGLARLGIEVAGEPIANLCRYHDELLRWNRKINLVGQAEPAGILENHFLDSLTLLPFLDESGAASLLDIGSGAGFPGLAVKIARPDLEVTLAEPRQKRAAFLRQVIRLLALTGISVYGQRLEPGANQGRRFPVITGRAVADIAGFLDLCQHLSPADGLVICMKGPKAGEELARWRQTQPASPFQVKRIVDTRLPFSGATRKLIIFARTSLNP